MNNNNITFCFQEKIERANRDFGLFEDCRKILVGLSGGADSTSLLLSLKQISEKFGFEVFALHVNHMIRGEEADRDERFSENLCRKHGIKFFCERINVSEISKKSGQSLELCARNERYKAFEKICMQNGISHVATAHNACDNAETLVFNLVRGTGNRGLCGIPPKRRLCDGVAVIRPLIYAERFEIEQYLAAKNQDYVTDSTNSDSGYTRNYIRNEIMPLIRSINPSFEETAARTARLLRNDEEYLAGVAKENLSDSIEKLALLHESVLSRVVIMLFSEYSDETLSELHVKELCKKIYEYNGEKDSFSLPGLISAKLYRGRLYFVTDKRKVSERCDFDITACRGEIFFSDNPYALYVSSDEKSNIPKTLENNENVYKMYTQDYLYFDTIPAVLRIRNRRDGDKIKSGGMNKSIKRLLVSSAYSDDERYLLPFVCEGDNILLVPNVAVCDGCKKTKERTKKMLVALYRKT